MKARARNTPPTQPQRRMGLCAKSLEKDCNTYTMVAIGKEGIVIMQAVKIVKHQLTGQMRSPPL